MYEVEEFRKPTYREKLQDPRWQEKRLRVMESAGFKCEKCGSRERNLQVHHNQNQKGLEPWEYSNDDLELLCDYCHKYQHRQQADLIRKIKQAGISYEMLIGLCDGYIRTPSDMRLVRSPTEYAEGYYRSRLEFDLGDAVKLVYEEAR